MSKRKIFISGDDEKEVSEEKSQKIDLDEEKKLKCLQLILTWYYQVCKRWFPDDENCMEDIRHSIHVTSAIFTCHNILRQRGNNPSVVSNADTKAKGNVFKVRYKENVINIPAVDLLALMKKTAEDHKMEYKKFSDTDKKNWYGTVAPYLNFFVGFKNRMDEVRTGNSKMPMGKTDHEEKFIKMKDYGLTERHFPLLEGNTFPPERRSAIAQSLGPLTTLLLHVRTKDPDYRKKWTKAARRALGQIPFIDDILSHTAGKPAFEIRDLIKTVADLALHCTARNVNRMFLPLCCMFKVYCGFRLNDDLGDEMAITYQASNGVTFKNELMFFTVSGVAAFITYDKICKFNWKFPGTMDIESARQVFFHAVMGSHKMDLSVAEQITDCKNFLTRRKLDKAFKDFGSESKYVTFTPIKLIYTSKLRSAAGTRLLAGTSNQVAGLQVFSGIVEQHFSDDYFEQLRRDSGIQITAKDPLTILSHLKALKLKLLDDLEKAGRVMEIGTSQWYKVDELSYHKKFMDLDAQNVKIVGKNKYFLNTDETNVHRVKP